MKRFAILLAAIGAVISLGAGQAGAGPPTTVVCGQVITQSIHVANDLLNCPADGLVIGAANIKVDLGHHVIDGDGINVVTDDGIDNTGGFDNVKITHGTIQQFSQGVRLVGATQNKVEHVTVTQTTRGIVLQTLSNDNKISHNKVSASFDGIHLTGSDANKVDHNDVFGNTASAIVLITGSDNNKVEHNRAHHNATWGITQDASNGNTYRHNKIFKNNTAGFEPFNSTNLRFEHNDVSQNHIGIELWNTDASSVTDNKIRSNTLDGIHSFNGSTGNLLKKNHADKNGDDGIDIADAGNTITKNHADKNTDLGIVAVAGNIDGGGNKAHHNGNPAQCVGVACH
jgi:parallel beta-helix repeat protein